MVQVTSNQNNFCLLFHDVIEASNLSLIRCCLGRGQTHHNADRLPAGSHAHVKLHVGQCSSCVWLLAALIRSSATPHNVAVTTPWPSFVCSQGGNSMETGQ